MKKYLFALLFISFGSMACFGGHWESESKTSTFTIDLTETGNHISGKYCFITNNGNRIDCSEQDDDDNIRGTVTNGKAQVSFDSTFGGTGKASLIIKNDDLIYYIKDKKPFVEENMSVPDKIVMKKKSPK
ncbi:hypothetical protein [Hafnia alvei]|uniref:Lipoprotein n=1 Tax=Hafnia alvei TaxID=569 RepID=A0A1C6Z7Z0_HAFAL|nr:hypothetical protein [Hafnia alvei]NLS54065.1 hypothetical protein [Hafnia alvei]SCM55029.1 hypothetical protein BN1044_04542 [Hafnia alvei]